MGLSRMGDEISFLRDGSLGRSVNELYGYREYLDPEYGDWQSWYAWYPVSRMHRVWAPHMQYHVRVKKWLWGERIIRRMVRSKRTHLSPTRDRVQWEYSTMMEVLRWG